MAPILILWFITPALRLNIDPRVSGVCGMDRNTQTTKPYLPPEKQDKGSVSLLQTIRDSILLTKLTMKSSGRRAKMCFVTYLLALVKNPAVQITFMYLICRERVTYLAANIFLTSFSNAHSSYMSSQPLMFTVYPQEYHLHVRIMWSLKHL